MGSDRSARLIVGMVYDFALRSNLSILESPLTKAEVVQWVYTSSQRIAGRVAFDLAVFFETCGVEACEALIVESFVGDTPVHEGSLRYRPSADSSIDRLVLWVEVRVDVDRMDVDWSTIDDDTPSEYDYTVDRQVQTYSKHNYAARSMFDE